MSYSSANVYRVYGYLTNSIVSNSEGVRPVINLSANVTVSSGDGTSSNPYVIAT